MKSKIFILLWFLNLQFFGQIVLGVDTLLKSGPINKRINLVIMGDGYTATQIPQFLNNATTTSNYLLSIPPFSNYKNYFNVFAIKCQSPQSGVSHPGTATDVVEPASPILSVTNNFNTRFDNNNTHRAIESLNSTAVYSVLASAFPAYDQAVVLGNSTEYGGTGGPYAVLSVNVSSPEIMAHEMGHSFAGLADEYWAGLMFANEKPNMTANSNPSTAKWSQWVGTNGIGLYQYDVTAPASGWFRPHQNCKMQFLGVPYCSVCRQTIIERIHSLTNPIEAYTPDDTNPVSYQGTSQWFKTTLLNPNPNTLKKTWKLNSAVLPANTDSLQLTNSQLQNGNNFLLFTVTDTTVFSRDTAHYTLHTYSVAWIIRYSNVGIKEISAQLEFSMFPNPASDNLNLKYKLLADAEVSVSVTDMSGKTIIKEKSRKEAAGEYQKEIDVSGLQNGNYILSVKINDKTIDNQFIIFK